MLHAFKTKNSLAYPRKCTVTRNRLTSVNVHAASSWSGTNVSGPEKGHHFLHIDDFSKEELVGMLDTAREVKAKFRARDESFKPFQGKTMAMIFTKPSMRTRVSFETVRMGRLSSSSSCQSRHPTCLLGRHANTFIFGLIAGFLPPRGTCSLFGTK